MTGYALDLSHHQDPAALPWESRFRGHVDAVICRSSYGILRDRHVQTHVKIARVSLAVPIGLYHFFRPSQTVESQWARLCEVADAVRLGPGDIVPAIDIEADVTVPVDPSWEPACRELVARMVARWGDALVYCTQREFGMLGKPAWLLKRPLWVAHYTGAATPATPGNKPATIWQHRVGPFVPNGPGGYDRAKPELDQNRILAPLPLIAAAPEAIADDLRERVAGMVALSLDDEIRNREAIDDGPEEDRLT